LGGKRLGVLGGTFNPIHFGHLHLAREARRLFRLTEIHFVVAAIPPHKPRVGVIPLLHRFAMVCLATAAVPAYIPSLIEVEPPESPFTVDSLRKVRRGHLSAQDRLFFLAGGDSLRDVSTWRESGRLLQECDFVFFARPGVPLTDPASFLPRGARSRLLDLRGKDASALPGAIRAADRSGHNLIYLVDSGAPDISSSRLRALAAAGAALGAFAPATVDRYIRKLNLYGA